MMETERFLRCTVCPIGCRLTATLLDNGEVSAVRGNTCPRGERYAKSEITRPVRTLTTTVFTTDGRKLPVRSDKPIAKAVLLEAARQIRSLRVPLPVHRGDVLLTDFTEPGISLIACKDLD